jgi:hypothetical protein
MDEARIFQRIACLFFQRLWLREAVLNSQPTAEKRRVLCVVATALSV